MAKKQSKNNVLPIYIVNGPNLNMLGTRETDVYGHTTLAQIEKMCAAQAAAHGLTTVFRQSNHEGEIVDFLQEARTSACAVLINPAAYGHTSVAVLDAIQALNIPVVEVHLSNIHRREPFRHHSFVSGAAQGIIMGFGAQGYLRAIDAVSDILKGSK